MEVEAALPPPKVRLNTNLRKYAFRALKLSSDHPIRQAIGFGYPDTLSSPGYKGLESTIKEQKQTQIERIQASISLLIDTDSLEPIQHFYFAPWERGTPYKVEISSLPKEEAAIIHQAQLCLDPGNIAIYTDGSLTPSEETKGVGVGVAILGTLTPSNPTLKENLGPRQLVYNAELEGITIAIETASQLAKPGYNFEVFSDNQAALYRLKNPSDFPGQACQIRAIKAARQVTSKGATIRLNWVPGHKDIPGNELADSLAKEATFEDPSSEGVSFAYLGTLLRKAQTREWLGLLEAYSLRQDQSLTSYRRLYPWKISSKIQLPRGVKRGVASAYYHLKFSHGYLKAYLNRLGLTGTDKC